MNVIEIFNNITTCTTDEIKECNKNFIKYQKKSDNSYHIFSDSVLDTFGNDLLLISGDFNGIKRFIYDNVSTKRAAKVLRSRSMLIQLITHQISKIIEDKCKAKKILFGAGKFLFVSENSDENTKAIDEIEKKLALYFYKTFLGESCFLLSSQEIKKDDLLNKGSNLVDILDQLSKTNEKKKYTKFSTLVDKEKEFGIFDIYEDSHNDSDICEYCNLRVGIQRQEYKCCDMCYSQIKIGSKLAQKIPTEYRSYMSISHINNENSIKFFEYDGLEYFVEFFKYDSDNNIKDKKEYFDLSLKEYSGVQKWSLGSYVETNYDGEVKSFAQLCENSSALMALKVDVDSLGDTFKNLYNESFKKYTILSSEIDNFFSNYAINLIAQEYKNIYVVFGGGDDLFLIGEYREVVRYAKELRCQFCSFSEYRVSVSMGSVMFKPSTPIKYIAEQSEKSEARAKANGRNSIDIFGISMKFEEFLDIEERFTNIIQKLQNSTMDTTSIYYKLIELATMAGDMADTTKEFDPRNAMWRSKLNYLYYKNIEDDIDVLKDIEKLISEYGKKLIPTINLCIYNKRDNKVEAIDEF